MKTGDYGWSRIAARPVLPIVLALLLSTCEVAGQRQGTKPSPATASLQPAGVSIDPGCGLKAVASLATRFVRLAGSGDEVAIAALLANGELFHRVSDSNVDPAESIHDRGRAIEYLAHDAVAYRLREMNVQPRLDKAAVDIVFLVVHPSGTTFLGKGEIRCNPMAINGWTIGSPDKRTESRGLCDRDDSIRLGNGLFCLG